jgi:hypothetical protein
MKINILKILIIVAVITSLILTSIVSANRGNPGNTLVCITDHDCLHKFECREPETPGSTTPSPFYTIESKGSCTEDYLCEYKDEIDKDNDGYPPICMECNDNDNSIYPGAIEVCNGKDDDCNGQVDEGFSEDEDNDGELDCVDTINGDASEITIRGLNEVTRVFIGGVELNTAIGRHEVQIFNGDRLLVEFTHDFDELDLDLTNLIITVEKRFISIEGLELNRGTTKTAIIEASEVKNSVCIKDINGAITISPKCTDNDEYALNCPGTNGNYECEIIEEISGNGPGSTIIKYFAVSGLKHSTIYQQSYCGDNSKDSTEDCDGTDLNEETCSSKGFDTGSISCDASCNVDTSLCSNVATGTGGTNTNTVSECVPDWECTEWSTFCSPLKRLVRGCTDINNCNINDDKPATQQSCIYTPATNGEGLNTEELTEGTETNQLNEGTTDAEGTDNADNLITGAVTGDGETTKSNWPVILGVTLGVILIGLVITYFSIKKKKSLKK